MSETPSRIYLDESTGRNKDEHLEVVFSEIFREHISDKEAIGALLDPYAIGVLGDKAIRFGNALDDVEQAIRWASQFDLLLIDPASACEGPLNPPGYEGREVNWVVTIGDCDDLVTARLLSHAIVLAGVHWLRMIADNVLNEGTETKH